MMPAMSVKTYLNRGNERRVVVVTLIVLFAAAALIFSSKVRNAAIQDCRELGGTPITNQFWSEDYRKVQCILTTTKKDD
jgi:hypothetical protein